MLRAFSTAATGMTAQQMIVDTISNNLANMNTVGFKKSQVDFQDLMYVKLAEPGREVAAGVIAPNGLEIGSGVRLHSNVFVSEFCHLEDNCWIGPGAALTNAKYPASPDVKRNLKGVWVKKGAIVGAGVVILPGIVIGEGALVGAGSVVTSDVQPGVVVAGNPARVIGETKQLRDAETGRLIYGERRP